MFIRFIRNLINPPTVTSLGRWNREHNADIKNILANYDHCGDTICKDPMLVSQFVTDFMKSDEYAKKKDLESPNN